MFICNTQLSTSDVKFFYQSPYTSKLNLPVVVYYVTKTNYYTQIIMPLIALRHLPSCCYHKLHDKRIILGLARLLPIVNKRCFSSHQPKLNTYTGWLKSSTKILEHINPNQEIKENTPPTRYEITNQLKSLIHQRDVHSILELIRLHTHDDLIDPKTINFILDELMSDINLTHLEIYSSDCEIEIPRYQAESRLDVDSPYYETAYERIPFMYKICQMSQKLVPPNDKQFQEHYIWLCYHMNDSETLESLLHAYLHQPSYNSKILGYIFSGFILNYEVEFAKALFHNVLAISKKLDVTLVETILIQFSRVDALFENSYSVFQWWEAKYRPSPKCMAVLLEQSYKYGNQQEIQYIHDIINKHKVSNNYRMKSIILQQQIIHREPHHFRKTILKLDIIKINEISNNIRYRDELVDFYYSFLGFFVKYSDIKMIHYVIMSLKEHHIPLTDKFFQLVTNYYVRNNNCLHLSKFLENTLDQIEFNLVYLKKIYESFVKTYPYYAPEFHVQFHQWIEQNPKIPSDLKEKLGRNLKIVKSSSQLIPYRCDYDVIECNKRKYDSSHWDSISWKQDKHGGYIKFNDQIQYRVNKGFTDVLRKGVRPDISLIKNTFKRSDRNNKSILLDLLKQIRMYDNLKMDFELMVLQIKGDKYNLCKFYENLDSESMTSNNRIILARMLMNKNLFEKADVILEGINNEELNDKGIMVRLNVELRNLCNYSNFEGMNKSIRQFPIDEIILSPYMYNQCCYIEKLVSGKRQYLENKRDRYQKFLEAGKINANKLEKVNLFLDSYDATDKSIQSTLFLLQGLIADINLRLEKDKMELKMSVLDMFKFLDSWIDERYQE